MFPISTLFAQLLALKPLSEAQAEDVFTEILSGRVDDAQVGALLGLIAARGAAVDELVGGARVMRRNVTPVTLDLPGVAIIDTCGTGGAQKLFNVSTISAIVTAAAAPGRVAVAKHGSLSRTGRGSAEVLKAIGVRVDASPAVQARCLREIGVCFSFSIHHHPAMKHVAHVRKSLAFPTIFNLLGPLANPAGVRRQLVGAYSPEIASRLADALCRLGVDRAMVVTSDDGLDELTITAPCTGFVVESGRVEQTRIDATALGLMRSSIEHLVSHSLEQAVRTFHSVVDGHAGPTLDMVVLNAGAALWVGGAAHDLAGGIAMARSAIEQGRARVTLDRLVTLSHEEN